MSKCPLRSKSRRGSKWACCLSLGSSSSHAPLSGLVLPGPWFSFHLCELHQAPPSFPQGPFCPSSVSAHGTCFPQSIGVHTANCLPPAFLSSLSLLIIRLSTFILIPEPALLLSSCNKMRTWCAQLTCLDFKDKSKSYLTTTVLMRLHTFSCCVQGSGGFF